LVELSEISFIAVIRGEKLELFKQLQFEELGTVQEVKVIDGKLLVFDDVSFVICEIVQNDLLISKVQNFTQIATDFC
jgi:hypothetical protein